MSEATQQSGMPHIRPVPHSAETENAILGTVLTWPDCWRVVSSLVSRGDFYQFVAKLVFECMEQASSQRRPIDPVTVYDLLETKRLAQPEMAKATAYLAECMESAVSASSVRAHCGTLKRYALDRALLSISAASSDLAYRGDIEHGQKVEEIHRRVVELSGTTSDGMRVYRDVARETMLELERIHNAGETILGLSTGYPAIDQRWKGMRPGNLITLAGRPGMGKTTLAMNIAEHVAKRGARVLVFSLEMEAGELMEKTLSALSGVDYRHVQTGEFFGDSGNVSRVVSAVAEVGAMDLTICEDGNLTIAQLIARARSEHAEKPLDLVVVDHLQLLARSTPRQSEYDTLSEASKGLKGLAKELRAPVLMLSQLNRDIEKRPANKRRPVMADLRGSGSIEQDSDIVAFVYREWVYDKTTPAPNAAEVISEKVRKGWPGTDYLRAELDRSRFAEHVGPKPDYGTPANDYDAGGFDG